MPESEEQITPEVHVCLGQDVETLSRSETESKRFERWLLPTQGGDAVQPESGVDRLLAGRVDLVRMLVANKHVFGLNMWQAMLVDPRFTVVLYEADGLIGALNLLNSLGSNVILDVPSIASQEGGAKTLATILERFLSDPLWRIQIGPFSNQFVHAFEKRPVGMRSRWSFRPGTFGVRTMEDLDVGGSPTVEAMVADLHASQPTSVDDFRSAHSGCNRCEHRDVCGGQLVTNDQAGCPADVKELVSQIANKAAEVAGAQQAAAEAPATP